MSDFRPTECPECRAAGRVTGAGEPPLIQVVNTRVEADVRVRYLGCRRCGFRPRGNKRVVPIEAAPARRERLAAT